MRLAPPYRPTTLLIALVIAAAPGGPPVHAQAPEPISFALPADETLAADAARSPSSAPRPLPEVFDIEIVEARLAEVFAGLPEAEWTIPGLAAAMDYDPTAPFVFVRDRIAFQPYAGVLRGATGTLTARAGNSWDRALLLKALLDEMAVPARLAWGELLAEDAPTVSTLVAAGLDAPAVALDAALVGEVSGLILDDVVQRARRDHAVLRATLGDRFAAVGDTELAQATRELRSHAWVQAFVGTEWVDLDPSTSDATPGTTLVTAAATGDEPPADQRQRVTLRVVVEHLDAASGTLGETVVLESTLDAADSADRFTTLTFTPESTQLGATITTLFSGVADWKPVLGTADVEVDGAAFTAGGRGSDLFGEDVDAPELTAVRLELVSSGPDRADATATSPILDRVPSAVRAAGSVAIEDLLPMAGSDTGPAALGRVQHVIISVGALSARDHVGDLGAGLGYLNDVLLDPELAAGESLGDMLRPLLAADDHLVAGSELLAVPALREDGRVGAFVAAPRVYLAVFGPSDVPDEFMGRFDLALDGVRVLGGADVPGEELALRRLWYGALQSAVETELGLGRARATDPAAVTLAGATFTTGGPMVILDAAAVTGRTDLPVALATQLAAGDLAVVPDVAGAPGVWWAVAPDGLTRSMTAPGHGNIQWSAPPKGRNYGGLKQRGPVPRGQSGGGGRGTTWGNRGGKTVPLGSSCNPAGGSTGYTTVTSCVSVPGGIAFRLALATAIDAVIFAAIYGAFMGVEAAYGPG